MLSGIGCVKKRRTHSCLPDVTHIDRVWALSTSPRVVRIGSTAGLGRDPESANIALVLRPAWR
jgi:hypothetical protein